MGDEKKFEAEEAVRELTLALLFLKKYNIADWESLAGTEDWPLWLETAETLG